MKGRLKKKEKENISEFLDEKHMRKNKLPRPKYKYRQNSAILTWRDPFERLRNILLTETQSRNLSDALFFFFVR